MIDIFYRTRGAEELMHPRVVATTAPDAERAQHLIETLGKSLDAEGEAHVAGGRPSRRRGSVAQLVARRDQALDREISEILKAKGIKPHVVSRRG